MNNLQRLEMETKGIDLSQNELIVYLQEEWFITTRGLQRNLSRQ